MPEYEYTRILKELGCEKTTEKFGDDFFLGLGAESLDVMDASNYEGARIIHDLNEPINPDLYASFDTVLDGGTLEHVFHFPNSIRSCMELVKPGGHLILMTPWHNYSGHGFYQFSPELFYNILSPDNGYIIESMMIVSDGYWYGIKNPAEVRSRIEISTTDSVDLYIIAKRTNSEKIFRTWPQQSDYSAAWSQGSYGKSNQDTVKTFKDTMIGYFPALGRVQAKWRQFKARRLMCPARNPGMVRICRSHDIPCR